MFNVRLVGGKDVYTANFVDCVIVLRNGRLDLREMLEYIRRYLSSYGMILSVKNTDDLNVVMYPGNSEEHSAIGFNIYANAKAGEYKGRIEINAIFTIPEDKPIKLSLAEESLGKFLDSLEFIRVDEGYPLNESIHTILKKEKS